MVDGKQVQGLQVGEREPLPCRVYTPQSSIVRPFTMVREMCRDVVSGRGLAWRLAVRDIKAQYRQAFLGLLWALILPLANTAAWVFLNLSGIVSVAETDIPYPLFVFTGTMLWSIFMDALNAPLSQAIAAKPMLAKIDFPRESLIVSGILQTLFNSGIKVVLLVMTLFLFGIRPDWHLVLLPAGVLSLILAGTVFGLLVTPVGLLYTDVGKGLPLIMQFAMFVTPVVFPMPAAGPAASIFQYNPLTPLLLSTRQWLVGLPAGEVVSFVLINLSLLLVLAIIGLVFRLAMPILIERMGS